MENEDIAPHVKEVARVLGNKVEESKIEEEMENYLKVYRVSMETAKRSMVKNFGGDPNALVEGRRAQKVADLKAHGSGAWTSLVKVMSANPKESGDGRKTARSRSSTASWPTRPGASPIACGTRSG